MKLTGTTKWFWIACGYEATLLILAMVLGLLFRLPIAELWTVTATACIVGVVAALPLLAAFAVSMRATAGPLASIRRFLEGFVRPLFGQWTVGQLLLISGLAGLGEEFLFRGVIQHGLTAWLGVPAALAIASALFGLCHYISTPYAVAATLVGAYLGIEFVWTGSLLAPTLTHALYDLLALLYFLRYTRPSGTQQNVEAACTGDTPAGQ